MTDLVGSLNDSSNVIVAVTLGFPGPQKTLRRLDLLVQMAFDHRQLPGDLQRIEVCELRLLRQLRNDRRRLRIQRDSCFGSGIIAFLLLKSMSVIRECILGATYRTLDQNHELLGCR